MGVQRVETGYVFTHTSDDRSLIAGGFKPQFLPSLPGIVMLFSRAATAASLGVHLLCINLFAACRTCAEGDLLNNFCRFCFQTHSEILKGAGTKSGVPTRHTTLLCMLLGPLGLLSHYSTLASAALRAPSLCVCFCSLGRLDTLQMWSQRHGGRASMAL